MKNKIIINEIQIPFIKEILQIQSPNAKGNYHFVSVTHCER